MATKDMLTESEANVNTKMIEKVDELEQTMIALIQSQREDWKDEIK